ncbi:Ribosomal small subunit pseudouridine synthase A [Porphyridium purpureum]|uniref:Ribosomal small subunit pseudouridine synthase A n=1 Tax=Porphyridium purpureum TaxID=35688 RepID=A0A5J4YJ58_PORPP|nr:Ribosomal small subunit pseudouridine synthase A [Porphyridium purpureum]|eukprot:POR8229..scf251_18
MELHQAFICAAWTVSASRPSDRASISDRTTVGMRQRLPADALSLFGDASTVRAERFLNTLNVTLSRSESGGKKGAELLRRRVLEIHYAAIGAGSNEVHRVKSPKDKIPLKHFLLDVPRRGDDESEAEHREAWQKAEDARARSITLDGVPVGDLVRPIHVALYKPVGYVCSRTSEPVSRADTDLAAAAAPAETIYSLLPDFAQPGNERNGLKMPIASIGRLDKMASGLVLLTQSGGLNHLLTSPSRHAPKCYRVELADPVEPTDAAKMCQAFESGSVEILERGRGGQEPCKPAPCTQLARHVFEVLLYEGKYHQLRRMFGSFGHKVIGIHREWIGTKHHNLAMWNLQKPGDWSLASIYDLALLADVQNGGQQPDAV